MFRVSVSIRWLTLRRYAVGLLSLALVATPALATADGSPVSACSAEVRQALSNLGSRATVQCDGQTLNLAGLAPADPSIAELLNKTGSWAAEAYTAARGTHAAPGELQ